MAPCVVPPLVYNGQRGVRNLVSGHRTRQTCGIFVPAVPGAIAPACPINGREGRGIPNTRRRLTRFSTSRPPFHWGSPFNLRNRKEQHHDQ